MSITIQKIYNPLTNLVRRIIKKMKTNEFRTSLIMVLIPLAFTIVGQAFSFTNLWVKISLDVIGLAMILGAIRLWNVTWAQLKKDDFLFKQDHAQQRQEHHNTDAYFQSLISEIKGLRQDINGFRNNLTNTNNGNDKAELLAEIKGIRDDLKKQ